jgi:flagellar basal-body rod protein FlgB
MEFNKTTIGAMAKTAMSYNMQRQAEIGKNIANIDTPNYEAKDLKKLDFSKLADAEAKRLEMRATAPKHMQGTTAQGGAYADERNRHAFETTPVGNNVVLEEQMANINEIGLKYQLASSIYRKMNGLFKMAVNGK